MPECVFCNIVKGTIPAYKVFENDLVLGFLDINPGNKGHVVVTTKKHVQGIHELSPGDVAKVFQAVRLILLGVSQSLNCEGANIVYSLGAKAGQRSDHMIIHVIPRYDDDKVIIHWDPKQGDQAELEATAKTIDKAIKSIPEIVSKPEPRIIEEKPEEKEELIEEGPRVPDY
jgi:histidine triad (HIT) family protein